MSHASFQEDFLPIQVMDEPVEILQGHSREVFQALFSDNGIFVVSTDGKEIRIWKRNEQNKYIIHHIIKTDTQMIALTPDGNLIASIEKSSAFSNKVHIWSIDGELIITLSHTGNECNCVFSPDNSQLVVADSTGQLQLWDLATFLLLCEIETPPESEKTSWNNFVRCLAFAPDGKHLAIQWYTRRGAVQIYNIEIIKQEKTVWQMNWVGAVAPHVLQAKSIVTDLSFSPDWCYLAVVSDQECRVWLFDAFSLEVIGSFDVPTSAGAIVSIAFSPDGTYLAIAGRKGTVWIGRVEDQQLLFSFSAHTSEISGYASVIGSIGWSVDGKLIMTTGMGIYETFDQHKEYSNRDKEYDYTVKLWKVKKKKKEILPQGK